MSTSAVQTLAALEGRCPVRGLKGLLAAVFLLAGGMKIYGLPMMVEEFEHMGLGRVVPLCHRHPGGRRRRHDPGAGVLLLSVRSF